MVGCCEKISIFIQGSCRYVGHSVDSAVGVGLSDGVAVPCTLEAARASLPITLRRPPQSVDAGGSGRQTVSPAAAHHTTTSLSLPSALLWCPAPTPDTNQTLHSAQTPSPAPGESQLTCQPKPQRASTSPLSSWRRGKQ